MSERYFVNKYPDYKGQPVEIDVDHVRLLIKSYVDVILENTKPGVPDNDERGDLYVGNAGIAYMFLKMSKSSKVKDLYPSIQCASTYINSAKANALTYRKRSDERCAFLCGNAGIYAVSAVISNEMGKNDIFADDLKNFRLGFDACKPIAFSKYGCDEILVGRSGYLSACYWLNSNISPPPISSEDIEQICDAIVESGRQYSKKTRAPLPLMYQYHGTEYLGAAHGLCSILQMLLESDWFKPGANISPGKFNDIRTSIDFYLGLQDAEGNFPVALEDLQSGREKRLVHWCHGAPGAIFLLGKSYLVFKEDKYLEAARLSADLVWKKGLLRKGPGICHGVAGNGYVFLLMYKLTHEEQYLYRAMKFMEFLTDAEFKQSARIPDRPFSLYEGLAGTVCFLVDLLEPNNSSFPFMDIFS